MLSKVIVVLVLGIVVGIEGRHFEIRMNYSDDMENFCNLKLFHIKISYKRALFAEK